MNNMCEVKYITYDVGTDYTGLCECIWGSEEEFIDIYEDEEEAIEEANCDSYGEEGQYVEVFINGAFFRDYTKD